MLSRGARSRPAELVPRLYQGQVRARGVGEGLRVAAGLQLGGFGTEFGEAMRLFLQGGARGGDEPVDVEAPGALPEERAAGSPGSVGECGPSPSSPRRSLLFRVPCGRASSARISSAQPRPRWSRGRRRWLGRGRWRAGPLRAKPPSLRVCGRGSVRRPRVRPRPRSQA